MKGIEMSTKLPSSTDPASSTDPERVENSEVSHHAVSEKRRDFLKSLSFAAAATPFASLSFSGSSEATGFTDENLGHPRDFLTIDVGPQLTKLGDFVNQLAKDQKLQDAFLDNPTATFIDHGLAPATDPVTISKSNQVFFSLLTNKPLLRTLQEDLGIIKFPRRLIRVLTERTLEQLTQQGQLSFVSEAINKLLEVQLRNEKRVRALLEGSLQDAAIRSGLPDMTDQEIDQIISQINKEIRMGTPLDQLGVIGSVDPEGNYPIVSGTPVQFGCIGIFGWVVAAVLVKTYALVNACALANVTAAVNVNISVNTNTSGRTITALMAQVAPEQDPFDAIRTLSVLTELTCFADRLAKVLEEPAD